MFCHVPHAQGGGWCVKTPLPLGGRGWERVPRRDGRLPGSARRFRCRASGPPPVLPRERGRGIEGRRISGCPFRHGAVLSGRGSGYSVRFRRRSVFGIGSSSRSGFVSASRSAAGPFSARIARAPVSAGAVRAPDCARETADAPVPFASAGVFFRGPSRFLRRNAKGGPASRLSLPSSYYMFPICQVMIRIFPEIYGQTGNIAASPALLPGGSAPISPRVPPGRPSPPHRGRGAARRPPGCGGRASRRLRASAGCRPRR